MKHARPYSDLNQVQSRKEPLTALNHQQRGILTSASSVLHRWELLSWRFEPNQPQSIISGLRETFIKKYVVERTSKAETRPEGQSEKAENCRENLWDEIPLKGP